MTQEEKIPKLLTVQISVWTALCCLNEYLQEEGIKPENQKKKPDKMIQDLLSANTKIENCVDRLIPSFNLKQGDYINQVSYRIEDLVKLSYGELSENN
jgi:hypothetical protein